MFSALYLGNASYKREENDDTLKFYITNKYATKLPDKLIKTSAKKIEVHITDCLCLQSLDPALFVVSSKPKETIFYIENCPKLVDVLYFLKHYMVNVSPNKVCLTSMNVGFSTEKFFRDTILRDLSLIS